MVASIPNDVFQFSTYAAMLANYSIGQPRTADLTSHGTDGIGVYEDGTTMILLDNEAYAIRKDGTVIPAPMSNRLSFAMVTMYQYSYRIQLPSLTKESLEDLVSSAELGPAKGINTLMPFKVTGTFTLITLKEGGSHDLIRGTIFGFVVPQWMMHISGPRVFAEFLDEDQTKGGLIDDFEIDEAVTLTYAKCGRFHLGFPQGPEWEDVRLPGR
ncbi:alpha-acetolactate decarboxylase [Phaeosphaeriaceae sp. PMI808]|nr:alpha-acetolactate decarboxylase [Phaeosphaeriaceae sp. PMI808]